MLTTCVVYFQVELLCILLIKLLKCVTHAVRVLECASISVHNFTCVVCTLVLDAFPFQDVAAVECCVLIRLDDCVNVYLILLSRKVGDLNLNGCVIRNLIFGL